MENRSRFYQITIAISWITLLQLVVVMFIVSILRGAVANDFSGFAKDPGEMGTNIMIVVFTIYALLPIFIFVFTHVIFRWIYFALAIFFLLFFVAHQITHMIVDNMPLNMYHLLDFAHHGVMIFVIVLSLLWARRKELTA